MAGSAAVGSGGEGSAAGTGHCSAVGGVAAEMEVRAAVGNSRALLGGGLEGPTICF